MSAFVSCFWFLSWDSKIPSNWIFFLICFSGWLDTRQESSVKHQCRKVFGKSTAILSGSTFSEALRFRNKSQPSWSCLHFLSLPLFFPVNDRHISLFFSPFFLHPQGESVKRIRCFLSSLKASPNHVEERFFPVDEWIYLLWLNTIL